MAKGELRAGQSIFELMLGRELGASRTPIREALEIYAEGRAPRLKVQPAGTDIRLALGQQWRELTRQH